MKVERVICANATHEVVLVSGDRCEVPDYTGTDRGAWVWPNEGEEAIQQYAALVLAGQEGEGVFPIDHEDRDDLAPFGGDRLVLRRAVQAPPPSPASPSPPAGLSDMKEALSSVRKADTTHIRTPLLVYGARACEYGSAKYERANYLRPVGGPAENYERLRAYLRAAKSHIEAVLDSMEMHQSQDPKLVDVEGMKTAAYCKDTDTKPGDKVGPSGLPHLCGAVASLMMGITQATVYGLLPADPGQPWTKRMEEG